MFHCLSHNSSLMAEGVLPTSPSATGLIGSRPSALRISNPFSDSKNLTKATESSMFLVVSGNVSEKSIVVPLTSWPLARA
jgi:hypothetical protein